MYLSYTSKSSEPTKVVQAISSAAELSINLCYLVCLFNLVITVYEVLGWETK
jgi:hypothetical protein